MAYEKQTFKNGQVLSADQLNHIEEGIYNLSNSMVGAVQIIDNIQKGEIFNDYENNIACGMYSHSEGKETTTIPGLMLSDEVITYVSYTNNILTLSVEGDFFVNNANSIYGFIITNIGGQDSYKRERPDIVKVVSNEQSSDNWTFTIEDPIKHLDLETPNTITISAILIDSLSEAGNQHSEGSGSVASGDSSHAEGKETLAAGAYSHSSGWGTIADGNASHTEGFITRTTENYGHAEGYKSTAGYISHAEGNQTEALGDKSHSEGALTKAIGKESHAEGYNTKAIGQRSHAEGGSTTSLGLTSHTEGFQTLTGIKGFYVATKEEDGILSWDIDNSNPANPTITLESYGDESYGTYAVKDYVAIKVGNSFDLNFGRIRSITDNKILLASIPSILLDATPVTHGAVIFVKTKPEIGAASVGGTYAHAEGSNTKAFGDYSHSEGLGTVAAAESQHASGKYNIGKPDTLYEVGNGTGEYARSNAFEVYADGHAEVQIQGNTDNSVVLMKTLLQSIPETLHVIYSTSLNNSSVELPNAFEWFYAHTLYGGKYAESGFSHPVLVTDGSECDFYIVHYSYAEINIDNPDERAVWVKFNYAKTTDIPSVNSVYGLTLDNGHIKINAASEAAIKVANNSHLPIVPSNLGFGVGCHGIARFSTMPTAERKYLDWIVLYTGETDGTYIKYSLYTCVNDSDYKWIKICLT